MYKIAPFENEHEKIDTLDDSGARQNTNLDDCQDLETSSEAKNIKAHNIFAANIRASKTADTDGINSFSSILKGQSLFSGLRFFELFHCTSITDSRKYHRY